MFGGGNGVGSVSFTQACGGLGEYIVSRLGLLGMRVAAAVMMTD